MDVNKEVDRLDQAIKRGDIDEAVEIDTNLAQYELFLQKSLEYMPCEHDQTMGFYFRDWIMHLWDEIIFVVMIVMSFQIQNEFFKIILGGAGALLLIYSFLSRRQFASFQVADIIRMRNEKMVGNEAKMQLNFIMKSRMEHKDAIETALKEKFMNKQPEDMQGLFQNLLNITTPQAMEDTENDKENDNGISVQEDDQDPPTDSK